MKATTMVAAAAVVIALAAGAWFLFMRDTDTNQTTTPIPTTTPSTPSSPSTPSTPSPTPPTTTLPAACNGVVADGTLTINYTNNDFMADGVTGSTFCVKKGTTVTFAGSGLWVASDPHPVHTDLSGFDAQSNKSSFSFKFDTVGEHGFHNHSRASDTGTIVVVN